MKLKKETIMELGVILKEEFGWKFDSKQLDEAAYSLIGFFDLLLKISGRGTKFENHLFSLIDGPLRKEKN